MKKILALILSIMMLATFMPMMALADTTEDTTDIKTSMGLNYTPYEVNIGDTGNLTEDQYMSLRKDVTISSGNANRKWTTTPPYVRVELEKVYTITGVLAFSGGGVHYANCTVRYSLNGTDWYDLATTASTFNKTASDNTYYTGSTYAKYFAAVTPVDAKYLEITNTGNNNISRMNRINIYGTEPIVTEPIVIDVPTNVSLTDEILTWNAIEDTTATYLVNVYNNDGSLNQQIDTTYTSENTSTHVYYSSCYIGDYINAAGTYKITVQAKVGNDVSAPTEEITVELDGNQNLSLTSTSQTLYNTTAGTSSTFNNNMSTHKIGENIYGYLQIDLAQASMIENFTLVVNSQSEEYVNYGSVKFSADGTTWFTTKCSIAKVRVGGYYNHILTPQAPIYAKYVRFEKNSAKEVNFRKAVIDGKAVESTGAITALDSFLKVAPVATDSTKNSYDAYNFAGSIASGNTAVIECVNTTAPIAIVSGLTAKVPTYVKTSADDNTKASSHFKITVTNTEGSTATGMFSIDRRVLETGYTFPSIAVNNIAVANAGDKVKATVTVANDNIEEAGSAVVLVAIYKKNGELLTMQSVSPATTISDFAPMEAVDTREVEIDAPTEVGTYVAKAFVLKNMNTIVPLAAAGVTEFTIQ